MNVIEWKPDRKPAERPDMENCPGEKGEEEEISVSFAYSIK